MSWNNQNCLDTLWSVSSLFELLSWRTLFFFTRLTTWSWVTLIKKYSTIWLPDDNLLSVLLYCWIVKFGFTFIIETFFFLIVNNSCLWLFGHILIKWAVFCYIYTSSLFWRSRNAHILVKFVFHYLPFLIFTMDEIVLDLIPS